MGDIPREWIDESKQWTTESIPTPEAPDSSDIPEPRNGDLVYVVGFQCASEEPLQVYGDGHDARVVTRSGSELLLRRHVWSFSPGKMRARAFDAQAHGVATHRRVDAILSAREARRKREQACSVCKTAHAPAGPCASGSFERTGTVETSPPTALLGLGYVREVRVNHDVVIEREGDGLVHRDDRLWFVSPTGRMRAAMPSMVVNWIQSGSCFIVAVATIPSTVSDGDFAIKEMRR